MLKRISFFFATEVFCLNYNNLYNFKNTIRHFIDIDNLLFPSDVSNFDKAELCWTVPISYKIKKDGDKFRTIKVPNPLNFVRAYYYYCNLPNFNDINSLDAEHKRMSPNLETGDFAAGEYDNQLEDDFTKLCIYDCLLRLDISEYYSKIYTHYLDLEKNQLEDCVLSSMYNGRTSGILMGNYLSLYFAEYILSKISKVIDNLISEKDINCEFNYFSDDFYFFCNEYDKEKIIAIFDEVLDKFDFNRKEHKNTLWSYETYNSYNILTRYWKATVRHWNVEVLKDYQIAKEHSREPKIKLAFLNQLIYRLSSLKDEKSKRIFVVNFFKTKHFQETDFEKYEVRSYDYHQLFNLLKLAPEALVYTSYIFNEMTGFDNNKIKDFLKARYKETLTKHLQDEQIYYYFALKCYGFEQELEQYSEYVLKSKNQVLISYYLKDALLSQQQIDELKLLEEEKYWFQNYHLILYCDDLKTDLETNVKKYLIPRMANNANKHSRYLNFYLENLSNDKSMINDIEMITKNIKEYLSLRFEETAIEFE